MEGKRRKEGRKREGSTYIGRKRKKAQTDGRREVMKREGSTDIGRKRKKEGGGRDLTGDEGSNTITKRKRTKGNTGRKDKLIQEDKGRSWQNCAKRKENKA